MPNLCTIVGAGPGLGAGLARRFASSDFQVALVGRTEAGLKDLARSITGSPVAGFVGDASDPASLEHALNRIHSWAGDTDVLIYNAAVMESRLASSLSAQDLADDMATNVGGAVAAVNMVLPAMRKRRSGTVLFTGGGLALEPYPDWASLAAGKAALHAYAIALHKEVAADGVHVAVVAICGTIEPGGPFDPDRIAELYWALSQEPHGSWRREVVFLPAGSDPSYNDPGGAHRSTSEPIRISDEGEER